MEIPQHPVAGAKTNLYLVSDDESVKVPVLALIGEEPFKLIHKALNNYKWIEDDVLLATYLKNGKPLPIQLAHVKCQEW